MNLGTFFYTLLFGNLVGIDEFKNKYYCNSKKYNDVSSKRWVIFFGEIEASKVPPHWHAWLHKIIENPPINYKHKYDWQKDHESNLTGTLKAYFPDSHPLSKQTKTKVRKEYENWNP